MAWEIWADEPDTVARRVSRARMHLLFVLIRYGALRLAEARSMDVHKSIDSQTGQIRITGPYKRIIMLPVPPMRHIRRIMAMEESRQASFLNIDDGFCRKAFYDVAGGAGIARTLAGPRALRVARAHELLGLHMPHSQVCEFLGIPNAF